MSELASVHLRQGRGFLRAGEPQRAVALLEKARAMARDDRALLRQILPDLADAYDAAGRSGQAGRCRDLLSALGPAPSADSRPSVGAITRIRPLGLPPATRANRRLAALLAVPAALLL